MKTALAIFAKTAELSPVKTRLAADIGEENAKAFYHLSVEAIEAVADAAAGQNICPHWCIGEADGIDYPQWQSFPSVWTGDGGLGTRLANISKALFKTHDAVIFIGTDSPQLSPDIFEKTIARLKTNPNECIAGPANDGGFYLFASSKPVSRKIWEAVQYSVETTLTDLEAHLQKQAIKTTHLEPEQDVDIATDLETLLTTLKKKQPELLQAQAALLDWLEEQNW